MRNLRQALPTVAVALILLSTTASAQDARVRRILEIIAAPENGRVFIHCRTGVDRTGMIVALYRMTHDGWSANDALAEADSPIVTPLQTGQGSFPSQAILLSPGRPHL